MDTFILPSAVMILSLMAVILKRRDAELKAQLSELLEKQDLLDRENKTIEKDIAVATMELELWDKVRQAVKGRQRTARVLMTAGLTVMVNSCKAAPRADLICSCRFMTVSTGITIGYLASAITGTIRSIAGNIRAIMHKTAELERAEMLNGEMKRKISKVEAELQRYRDKAGAWLDESLSTLDDSWKKESAFMEKLHTVMLGHISEHGTSMDDIAAEMGLSRSDLFRKVRAENGMTPGSYFQDLRLSLAWNLLETGEKKISEIACLAGFASPSYFSRCFRLKYGITPGEVRTSAEK